MKSPEALMQDEVTTPKPRGFFSKLNIFKKKSPIDPLDANEDYKEFIIQRNKEKAIAEYQKKYGTAIDTPAHTQQQESVQVAVTDSPVAVSITQDVKDAPEQKKIITNIKELTLSDQAEEKIDVMLKRAEQYDKQEKKHIDMRLLMDRVVLAVALVAALLGANLLYNQLPTYPMVTVGIVVVAASAGIITSITR
jgi:maltodextrin utilization protein YvdJ